MPWHVESDHGSCPASRPWAVVKDDDGEVEGCHATQSDAQNQLAALNAQEENSMTALLSELRAAPPATLEIPVLRAVSERSEVRAEADGGPPSMVGHFSVFNRWYEIDSIFEGRFLERVAPGAFTKTFQERSGDIKVLFQHGMDFQVGDKVLGRTEDLREDSVGAYYEVELFDTSYNQDLLPGLRAGVYGSSFRFRVTKDEWANEPEPSEANPNGIPERTIREVNVFEFGPVTFPANPEATAGVRSMTDAFYEHEPQRFHEAARHARDLRTPAGQGAADGTPAAGAAATASEPPTQGTRGGHDPADVLRDVDLWEASRR